MPRIVTATHAARVEKNEFKRGYQTTVFTAGMGHDFQVVSQVYNIGYCPSLFV